MNEPKNLDKQNDNLGYACLGVSVTVKLKGYDFFFRREPQDFVPDEGFTPFFWKHKSDDDTSFDGLGQDNNGNAAPNRDATSTSASMDVDKPQGDNPSSHGKPVSLGPVEDVTTPIFAVTPINPNPTTPRGKKIVEDWRAKSPTLLAGSSAAGCNRYPPVQRPTSSSAGLRPSASPLGRPALPADGAHVGSPPAQRGCSPIAVTGVAARTLLSLTQLVGGLAVQSEGATGLQQVGCSSPLEAGVACCLGGGSITGHGGPG
jgi:hypothetical protein